LDHLGEEDQGMDRQERAEEYFRQGFSCSQSVLAACADRFGLDEETALRVAGAFGGGLARSGETCGVISGALMVIGLKHGMVNAEDKAAKDETYRVSQQLMSAFAAEQGSTTCRVLLGYDLSDPEQRQAAHDAGATRIVCPALVRAAVRWLEAGGVLD
jgi:C_GCAxxG_C_C family probable redox protein